MQLDTLDLQFGPGSPSGFTPSGIASFSDLRPAAVVRELIQNSLDAAVEAGVPTANVLFRAARRKAHDIPSMTAYRKAFAAAVRTHEDMGGGQLPSQAERVVQVIGDAVSANEQDILVVLDNGIGLSPGKMTALLSDGVSAKGAGSTGTFGNGHSVAIPASDLRYVLYGGVTADGSRIGAGHAVLASSVVRNQQYQTSGDGFLITGFRDGFYEFAEGTSLPALIAESLNEIEQSSGHGTVVIISAFNNFRETASLWDLVSKAAACNFFQAISEGRLVVQVEDRRHGKSGMAKSVDRLTLSAVLETNREEKRTQAFLSGQRAFDAHDTLQYGKRHVFKTTLGEIQVRIRERSSGTCRVDLCRNGMWITDDKNIPGFYYGFQDRKPFHALLLLDSCSGGRLHELVRNAEGPLHDKLHIKQRLSIARAKELRAAFRAIRDQLRSVVAEVGSETYSPDDFLALDFGGDGPGGNAQPSFWGTPERVTRREPGYSYDESQPGSGTDDGGRTKQQQSIPSRPERPRPVLPSLFQAASVSLGPNRRRIRLQCEEGCKDVELRLCVDENVDATCDNLRRAEIETVHFTQASVGGRNLQGKQLVRQNGRVVGIRLGEIAANSSLNIEVCYELPDGLLFVPGWEPTLRVEVFRVPMPAPEGK